MSKVGVRYSFKPGKPEFRRMVKAMDPNETTAAYLEAIERDLGRLSIIERRLTRLEKLLGSLVEAFGTYDAYREALRTEIVREMLPFLPKEEKAPEEEKTDA